MWSGESGALLHTFPSLHSCTIVAAAVHPHDEFFVTAADDGSIVLSSTCHPCPHGTPTGT